MEQAIEKCKYCGRDLSYLEIYEKCPCQIDEIDKDDDLIISED